MVEPTQKDLEMADRVVSEVCTALEAGIVRDSEVRAPVLAALATARAEELTACVAAVEATATVGTWDYLRGVGDALAALRARGEAL